MARKSASKNKSNIKTEYISALDILIKEPLAKLAIPVVIVAAVLNYYGYELIALIAAVIAVGLYLTAVSKRRGWLRTFI